MGNLIEIIVAALVIIGPTLGWWFGKRKGKNEAERKAKLRQAKQKEDYEDAKEASHAGGAAWHDRLRNN